MLFGAEHVKRYVATDGEEGHDWQGASCLILTTKGRRTGEERHAPLIYGRHGEDFVVVASKGGAPANPSWYENLAADSRVRVQVRGERLDANARDATPEERPELWALMVREWPGYEEYQQRTDRQIPVVVLERA